MVRVVYIQTDASGRPYSANGAAAAQGFDYLGFEVEFFQASELASLPLTQETIVVGGVGTIRAALEKIGVRQSSLASVPAELQPFAGRTCWQTTVRQLRERDRFPVFIKPYQDAKAFNGRVVKSRIELNSILEVREGFPAITEDFPLMAQEAVVFTSEWRTFVLRGVILGVSHHTGDPLIFPNADAIRYTLGAYSNAPAGYAADFGITDSGRTLLVEINDGYSLGHGGLLASSYAKLLRARWDEMVAT